MIGVVLVVVIIFAFLYVFNITKCTDTGVVTFEVKTKIDSIYEIDPKITKQCVTSPLPSSLGNNTEKIIATKDAISKISDQAQTKKAEVNLLVNQTNTLKILSQQNESQRKALDMTILQLNASKQDLYVLQQDLTLAQNNLTSIANSIVIAAPKTEEQKQQLNTTINKINFIPAVELDQKIYTWTDRVYITIISPSDNRDPNTIESIGTTKGREIVVSTNNATLNYTLTETGYDTGIFTGYITLSGFPSINVGDNEEPKHARGYTYGFGPIDGLISATPEDKITVTYHYAPGITVMGSALIRWNIGEIKWLGTNYTSNGQGVVQIVDPDMNLDPNVNDTFKIIVFSNSDLQGTKITMTETGRDMGIFRGIVHFTNSQPSSGELKVSEGDSVTTVYVDRTLPSPYHIGDSLKLTAVQEIQYENLSFNETATPHISKGKN